MAARIIDGKAIAARVRAEAANRARELSARGVVPGLAVVLVGDDPASQIYVRAKTRACIEAGIKVFDFTPPPSIAEADLVALVERLGGEPTVDAVLVQLPLPKHIDGQRVLDAIPPGKDVDGLHPVNVGRLWQGRPAVVPCTPAGIMRLLEESGIELRGADAVVIGRSNLVGKPVAALFAAADATVTLCHSKSRDLPGKIARADVVVAAIGRPAFVRGEWIKPGAVVIDVGVNRMPDGGLVGDVEFEARQRAFAITPVPGGVGPMTIAMLVRGVVEAAHNTHQEGSP